MKKYKPYLTRVDLVKNQVERERIQEQEAAKKRKQRIQEQNRKNHLRYQEQLRSEMAARYFHSVMSTGGEADTFSNTKSLNFDGSDDFVDCGDSNDFSFTTGSSDLAFSVSFWLKINSTFGTEVFISKDAGGSNREWAIGTFSNLRRVRFFLKNQGGGSQQSIDGNTSLTPGQWYSVVCTYDGRGGSNAYQGLNIYIDGALESVSASVNQSYTYMSNTSAPLVIGSYASQGYLDGSIDEASIFNTELSQTDITNIYNSGVPNDISSLSPISWWRFEGTGTTAIDSGSGGNNGTINGATRDTDVPTN